MSATLFASVFGTGGRVSRYGEFTIFTTNGCSFATSPLEFERQQAWASARSSSGDAARDCALFLDRFETIIGRDSSGMASKGSRMALLRIVKAMKASSIFMEGWDSRSLPIELSPT
jgi:hypothetical protein